MSNQDVGPVQAEGDGPSFELHRRRHVDAVVLTLTLMVSGWFAGRSFSHWLSLSLAVEMVVTVLCLGLAVFAAYLSRRLEWFVPGNSLILKVSANGLVLGFPTSTTLAWDEIDQVRLIRSQGGRLPIHHLQLTRRQSSSPATSRPEIMHHLGVLWDRRSKELLDALDAFRPQRASLVNKDYDSASWTGIVDQ